MTSENKPKKYKYNIYVNQFAIIEHDLNIDFIEAAIFGMLQMFAHQEKCNKMMDAGKVWYKFQWKIIPQQLPTLGIKGRTACYNRMKSLCGAGMLVAHENNQQNRCSWYTFGVNADLYNTVHQSKHTVHQNEHKQGKEVRQDEQGVHEGKQSSVHEGKHDNYTNPNYTNNNIDIEIPKEIGGIKFTLPSEWSNESKLIALKYFNYRHQLPKKDRLKTEFGYKGKIKAFSEILKNYDQNILLKAIELTIGNEWKDVNIEWLFKKHPELKPTQQQKPKSKTLDPSTLKTYQLELLFGSFKIKYSHKREKELVRDFKHTIYETGQIIRKELIEIERPAVENEDYLGLIYDIQKNYPELYKKAEITYNQQYNRA